MDMDIDIDMDTRTGHGQGHQNLASQLEPNLNWFPTDETTDNTTADENDLC